MRVIFCSIVLFSLCGCNGTDDIAKTEDRSAANLEIINKYRQAVESNDVATMDTLLADNYMGYGPSVGDSTTKEQSIANWKQSIASLYESVKYTRSESYPIE